MNSLAHLSRASVSSTLELSSLRALRGITNHGDTIVLGQTDVFSWEQFHPWNKVDFTEEHIVVLCTTKCTSFTEGFIKHHNSKLKVIQPSDIFDNHLIIDWPSWPIIWMTSECVNVTSIPSTKMNHGTKIVVKIMQEFIVHMQMYSHRFWYLIGYEKLTLCCWRLLLPL